MRAPLTRISVETGCGQCGAARSDDQAPSGWRWSIVVTLGLVDPGNPGLKEASNDLRGAYTGCCSGDSHQEGC
jgi:hypothetical protein